MIVFATGTHRPLFARQCWASQESYAKRNGAEYRWVPTPATLNPVDTRLDVMLSNTQDDELILWLDWDVEVSHKAPCLAQYEASGLVLPVFEVHQGFPIGRHIRSMVPGLASPHYNIGVMLGRRSVFEKIRVARTPDIVELADAAKVGNSVKYEISFLLACQAAEIEITSLPQGFHVTPPDAGYFVHRAGKMKG